MELNKDLFNIEVAGNTATVKAKEDNLFFENTDLTKKQIEEVFKHSHEYVTAVAEAAANIATDIMQENDEVEEVVVEAPYGISKRGHVTAKAKRKVTFPGMNGSDPVTRSDLRVAVTDPMAKVSKSKLKDLQAAMTEKLLG